MSTDFESTVIGAQQIKTAVDDLRVEEESIAIAATTADSTTGQVAPLDDGDRPTAEDLATLRRVPDKFNWNILTIGFIELCERFSFYGCVQVFTNYIQHPLPPGSRTGSIGNDPDGQPGALGLGQRASTSLGTFNQWWTYTSPLAGAYIADAYLGRYRTICWALLVGIIGHVLLVRVRHGQREWDDDNDVVERSSVEKYVVVMRGCLMRFFRH